MGTPPCDGDMIPHTRASRSGDAIISPRSAHTARGRRRRTQLAACGDTPRTPASVLLRNVAPRSLHEQAGTGVPRSRGGAVFKKTARAERDRCDHFTTHKPPQLNPYSLPATKIPHPCTHSALSAHNPAAVICPAQYLPYRSQSARRHGAAAPPVPIGVDTTTVAGCALLVVHARAIETTSTVGIAVKERIV